MADSIKILAQLAPSATTLTDFYVVPSGASTTISSIFVANRSFSADATFRVSVAFTGATDSNEQYLYYDVELPVSETFVATVGITMSANDIMRVYASNENLSFNLFGVELI